MAAKKSAKEARVASPKKVSAPKTSAAAKRIAKKTGARDQKVAALTKTAVSLSSASGRRATELIAEIKRRKEQIASEFYDIGIALRELLKKKLYLPLGFASFDEMVIAHNLMAATQAYKLVRLVSSLPREKALAIGSEKAFLLTKLADATPEPDTAEWLLDQGTLPGGKAVAAATTRELLKTVKDVSKKTQKRASSPEEKGAERAGQVARKALRSGGAKGAEVATFRRKGVFWVRIEMPSDQAEAFFT